MSLDNLILLFIIFFNTTIFTHSDELVIEIDNPKFSEKGLDDRIYEIKAKKGHKYENDLELFIIEGKFKTNKNGKWIYLKAEKGNFSQIKNFIELNENFLYR